MNSAAPEPKLVVHVGLDSEWVTHADPVTDKPYNRILSYQILLAYEGRRSSLIVYPSSGSPRARLTTEALFLRIFRQALRDKVISRWPDRVVAFGHFLRADLVNFRDFWPLKRGFDGIGRTFTSASMKKEIVDVGEIDEGKRGSIAAIFAPVPKGQPPHLITIRYVDTMLLTPGRAGLAKAAELIGTKKVALPAGHSIDRMDRLLKENKAAFESYALHDAEIALDYGLRMTAMSIELGLPRLPSTLAGFGLQILRRQAVSGGADLDLDAAFGLETHTKTVFNEGTSRYRSIKTKELTFSRQILEEFGSLAYHGGRGESYWFGPTPIDTFYDYDLPGAYTTAMCLLRPLDYDRFQFVSQIEDFELDALGLDVAGAARVEFRFPPGTRFPCLPVRLNESLVYPLEGVSTCTIPELALARSMGADLKLLQGVIIPWASEVPVFQGFTQLVQGRRAALPRGSLEAQIWKEIGNSLYGKTAQGVHQKRVFDPRRGRYDEMPPSMITSAWYASFVTGFIRAVLGEILAAIPKHRIVVSATTDGVLTNAPLVEISHRGPLCQEFLRLRHTVFGTSDLLEEKHRVAQVVAMKTRGQFTGEEIPGYAPVLAKAGIKPDVPLDGQNDYIMDLFLNRRPHQTHPQMSLIGLQEQWRTESDMIALSREIRLNLEFDFKRQPLDGIDGCVRARRHLAFDTRPWSSVDEAENAKERFRGWTRSHGRLLKTRADLLAWQAYENQIEALKGSGAGVRSDGAKGHLYRQFLRALVRGEWGLDLDGRSYRDIADWLTLKGFESSVDDLKNAKRSKSMLVPRTVAVTEETIPLLRVIFEEFPDLDLEAMILPEHLGRAYEALGLRKLIEHQR